MGKKTNRSKHAPQGQVAPKVEGSNTDVNIDTHNSMKENTPKDCMTHEIFQQHSDCIADYLTSGNSDALLTYLEDYDRENDTVPLSVLCFLIVRLTEVDSHSMSSLGDTAPILEKMTYPSTKEMEERILESEHISKELLKAYYAMHFLTETDPNEVYLLYLRKHFTKILAAIFCVFQSNSRGHIRQVCRIIDYMMRFDINMFYRIIGSTVSDVERYLGGMLNYIQHPPIGDIFLMIVCRPYQASNTLAYSKQTTDKWYFFQQLAKWKVLQVVGERVYGSQYCEAHNLAAADAFIELINRLASDEHVRILLQPLANCSEPLSGLIGVAVDTSGAYSTAQRTAATRCVLHIAQKSVTDRVPGPPIGPYQSFGTTVVNLVPNELASLRDNIFSRLEKHLDVLLTYLLGTYQESQQSGASSDVGSSAVRHTSYIVRIPFTEIRLLMVKTLVQIVAQNPSILAERFDVKIWRMLMTWFFDYRHNNLYHAAFSQLVFIALRSDDQKTLEILMKKVKFVAYLLDHYQSESSQTTSNRGFILQCCNVIRLQAASQAPDAFLRSFLQSHTQWRQFQPELRARTNLACTVGLGFNVPQALAPQDSSFCLRMVDEVQGIDHGSDFAKSLGFIDDVAWPDTELNRASKKKKKKGKKKNKKKKDQPDSI